MTFPKGWKARQAAAASRRNGQLVSDEVRAARGRILLEKAALQGPVAEQQIEVVRQPHATDSVPGASAAEPVAPVAALASGATPDATAAQVAASAAEPAAAKPVAPVAPAKKSKKD